MRIAVAREIDAGENRVAATPETVKKMKVLGADVAVEPHGGKKTGVAYAVFSTAGDNRVQEGGQQCDRVRNGRGRCRHAGDRDCAPDWRLRHRHRRAAGSEGTG